MTTRSIGDVESGLTAGDRYPTFPTGLAGQAGGRGWEASQGLPPPPPRSRPGIASTPTVPPATTPPRNRQASDHTAYEQQFFPYTYSPMNARASRVFANHRVSGSSTSSVAAVYRYNDDEGMAAVVSPRIGMPRHTDGNPFFAGGRAGLTLANPDLASATTSLYRPPTPVAALPPVPMPASRAPLHVRYHGFQARSLRNSTSTVSSYDSTVSGPSAYSHMTRAVIGPIFQYDAPMPPFMTASRFQLGTNGDGGRDRFKVGSLDVPKDAVSRPGSGAMGSRIG
jgi:hypothetical protein